jgi:heme/copper-type cytochrome/quinol oxidase subunit 2
MLIVLLALQPVRVFGNNVFFPPDPVGEKLYRAHLWSHLVPVVIIVTAFLFAWLLRAARQHARKLPPDAAGSYDI